MKLTGNVGDGKYTDKQQILKHVTNEQSNDECDAVM